jgi:hypothetical protein
MLSCDLLPNEDLIAALLDPPTGERVEGGRAQGFAASQIESRMVPRTVDTVGVHETIHERPMVVTAMRFDREDLASRLDQQHLLITDVTDKLFSIKFGELDAPGEIGTCRFRLILRHGPLQVSVCIRAMRLYRITAWK